MVMYFSWLWSFSRRVVRVLQEEPPSMGVPAKLQATTLGDRLGSMARCTRAPWDNSPVGSCSSTTQVGGLASPQHRVRGQSRAAARQRISRHGSGQCAQTYGAL